MFSLKALKQAASRVQLSKKRAPAYRNRTGWEAAGEGREGCATD